VNEIESICRTASELVARGERSFLASVVRVRGSAYRRAGARLLFAEGSALTGSVSAGCIESELLRTGSWHAASRAVIRTFEAFGVEDDEARLGSGCGGSVDVLIEPVSDGCADALAFIGEALGSQQRVGLVTVVQSNSRLCELAARVVCASNRSLSFGIALGLESELELLARETLEDGASKARCIRRGALELLLEVLEPTPRLFVFGAQADAVPVVTFASELGWEVTVVSRQDRPVMRERFVGSRCRFVAASAAEAVPLIDRCARPLAVVMSHDYENDRETLAALLTSKARYLGVLGPLARTQRLLADIESAGRDVSTALGRIHAPVGLNIGAQTAAEIALAIVAEAQASLRGTDTRALREQKSSVQAAPAPDLRLALAEAAE
jgi:xanthine/CO dehydrogenase XdhC/CoxF family maturation factor